MNQNLIYPPESDPFLEETRAFWRETGRSLVRDSLTTIDEAAKQIIGVVGLLEGLYFHALTFSNLRGTFLSSLLLLVYLLPIVLLLISLGFALLIIFPDQHKLNFNSSEAGKTLYERIANDKLRALRISAVFLLVGIFAIGAAALIYLIG